MKHTLITKMPFTVSEATTFQGGEEPLQGVGGWGSGHRSGRQGAGSPQATHRQHFDNYLLDAAALISPLLKNCA